MVTPSKLGDILAKVTDDSHLFKQPPKQDCWAHLYPPLYEALEVIFYMRLGRESKTEKVFPLALPAARSPLTTLQQPFICVKQTRASLRASYFTEVSTWVSLHACHFVPLSLFNLEAFIFKSFRICLETEPQPFLLQSWAGLAPFELRGLCRLAAAGGRELSLWLPHAASVIEAHILPQREM